MSSRPNAQEDVFLLAPHTFDEHRWVHLTWEVFVFQALGAPALGASRCCVHLVAGMVQELCCA